MRVGFLNELYQGESSFPMSFLGTEVKGQNEA